MQTQNVQFLSGKENLSLKPDVKKFDDNEKALRSDEKSFKSILESVKNEKAVSSKNAAQAAEKKPAGNENAVSAAKDNAAEKTSETKKEKPAEKKNQKKNEIEKNSKTGEDEENSMTVEIELCDMAQDESALAQALSAASALQETDAGPLSDAVSAEGLGDAVSDAGLSVNADEALSSVASDVSAVASEVSDAALYAESVASVESEGAEAFSEKENQVQDDLYAGASVLENPLETAAENQVAAGAQEIAESDTDGKSVSETKSSDDGSKKSTFTVIDQRSAAEESTKVTAADGGNSDSQMNPNFGDGRMVQTAQIPVENQTVQGNDGSFQSMLSQQIQAGAPEFVKAGSILLKDNNAGSINLILKPESLGNVKVSLELSDKILSGQIVVQSKEAYEAFKQSMDTLRQAFQNNGFENADLNLVLAQNADSNGTFAQGQQQSGDQYMANRTYGDFAQPGESSELSAGSEMYTKAGDHQIDVVA